MINCKLDLAGNILKYIYGNLEPQSEFKERTDDWASLGVLRNYDQHELVEGHPVEDGFSDLGGFVYYPNYCAQDGHKCRVHVFLHGCTNSVENIGQKLVRYSGFLEYAASNNLIVAFPQNKNIRKKGDDQQCWSHYEDAIGDKHYADQRGIQNKAFKALVKRITSPRDASFDYQSSNIANNVE